MRILRNKISAFHEHEFNSKRTKASFFVKFLVQTCFIPVTISQEKILFKLFHWKTFVNLLYVGFYFSLIFALKFLNIQNQFDRTETSLEEISLYILWALANFLRIFPLILSYGLQNLTSRRFQTGCHQSSNKRFIISFLSFIVGLFFTIVDIEQLVILPPLKLVTFVAIFLAVFWSSSIYLHFHY